MRWLALACALFLPTFLSAQTFPALYEVSGLKPTERLEVREAPDMSARPVGSLPPDARDIEVIDLDETGAWGWVNASERSGWVAMEFMERQLAAGNTLLPRPLTCFGTEPFWNIDIGGGPIAELNLLDQPTHRFLGLWTITSANSSDHFALMAEGRGTAMNAFVQRAICTSSGSERIFGLSINLLLKSGDETLFYSGCCTISPVPE
jgi:uncharacterized membrane protein